MDNINESSMSGVTSYLSLSVLLGSDEMMENILKHALVLYLTPHKKNLCSCWIIHSIIHSFIHSFICSYSILLVTFRVVGVPELMSETMRARPSQAKQYKIMQNNRGVIYMRKKLCLASAAWKALIDYAMEWLYLCAKKRTHSDDVPTCYTSFAIKAFWKSRHIKTADNPCQRVRGRGPRLHEYW